MYNLQFKSIPTSNILTTIKVVDADYSNYNNKT